MRETRTHPISEQELMAYLDGELPVQQTDTVIAHLKQCRDCQALGADLQSVSRQLLEWEIEPPGSRVGQGLAEALDGTYAPERRMRGIVSSLKLWTWALGAAALAAVLLTARLFVPQHKVAMAEKAAVTDVQEYRGPAGLAQDSNGLLLPFARQTVRGGIVKDSLQSSPPLPQRTNSQIENGGPLIVRTAGLTVVTREFDRSRTDIDRILTRHQGYIAELTTYGPTGQGRSLAATLRVPAGQLDAVIAELKKLGRVDTESQSGEEVTQQYIDLQARLQNARNTEQRLTELLRERTGKLSDVLAVEEHIDATRGQIETMEAEQKNLSKRISFATLQLRLSEEYKESLTVERPSIATQLRNAAIDGYRAVVDGAIGILLFLLTYGPGLLATIVILFFPVRMLITQIRKQSSAREQAAP